jgi:hypothetical protein
LADRPRPRVLGQMLRYKTGRQDDRCLRYTSTYIYIYIYNLEPLDDPQDSRWFLEVSEWAALLVKWSNVESRGKMVFVKHGALATLAAATCISCAVAVDIVVQASGGNVTGKFGHPYGYGFLHEVSPSSMAWHGMAYDGWGYCSTLTLTLIRGYQQLGRWRHIRRAHPEPRVPVQP